MPLRDHFHPPLSVDRPWEGFHSNWAVKITDMLNESLLPRGYVAISEVHRGSAAEIDVATLQATSTLPPAIAAWTAPQPACTVPVEWNLRDEFEVRVINRNVDGRPRLVAAIELVSPANEDRPAHRQAFAGKCAGLLRQDISLIVVDVVTTRQDSLHQELLDILELNGAAPFTAKLYAIAYRTVEAGEDRRRLEIWPEALTLGGLLPTLPLWLTEELAIPVDLEAAYQRTCQSLRID